MTLAIIAGHTVAAQRVQSASFDVASIRHVNGSSPFPPLSRSGSGQLVGRSSLEGMIHWAYEVETYERVVPQDAGLARRLQELYEVNAKPPLKTPPYSRAEVMGMFRGLLAERFGLKIRIDNEIVSATVLRTVKRGVHGVALRPAAEGCEPLPAGARGGDPRFREAYLRNCNVTYFDEHVRGTATLDEFARTVASLAQRPILNRTELEGMYVIDVFIGRDSFPPPCRTCPAPPVQSTGPSFNDAVRDQMGLTAGQERQPLRVFAVEEIGAFVEN